MILVTTAGKVGTAAAIELAQAGQPVRVLVRDLARHESLNDLGVDLLVGDLDDAASVAAAVDGISSVILVSLGMPAQELRVVEAARHAAVGSIVKASSTASLDSPIERRRGQAAIEAGLVVSGVPHVILRSNAYMQNFLVLAPGIAKTNTFASSAGAGRVGLVDARDVGAVAARIASSPAGHLGNTYHLTGPELLSYSDVASILSRVLGRTIPFTKRTATEDEAAMVAAGVPESIAKQNAQAFSLIASGDAEWQSDDVSHILGRPARSFEQFAEEFAFAFGGKS